MPSLVKVRAARVSREEYFFNFVNISLLIRYYLPLEKECP